MRTTTGIALVLLLALATQAHAASASGQADGDRSARQAQVGERYGGWLGSFGTERIRRAGQGGYHALKFRVRPARRVRYRVCLKGGVGKARRCYRRRTNARGRSSINVSIFVNDRGGPGTWRAVWRVRGDRVAAWRFRLSPEGV